MSGLSTVVDELIADVDGVLLFTTNQSTYEQFADGDLPVIVVETENAVGAESYVSLPLELSSPSERVRFGIEGAINQGLLEEDEEVIGLTQSFSESRLDTVVRVRTDEFTQTGVYDLFANSRPDAEVVRDVFEVAIELGRKGQKGKPVGALFVVGDAGTVMNKSRPLSYNPFEKSHVDVGDPIVNVMLKEFSRLDGAFVISDSGKIVSAYRYLEPGAEGVEIPKGLGARHMAGGAITRDTTAIAIVLSESDGMVRAFKAGSLVLELDPEAY